jgi:hypothetical protein
MELRQKAENGGFMTPVNMHAAAIEIIALNTPKPKNCPRRDSPNLGGCKNFLINSKTGECENYSINCTFSVAHVAPQSLNPVFC